MESLLDLMKAARYTLVGEEQEMRKRAAYRAATGKANPRAKRSGIAHDAEPTDSVSAFNRTFPDEGVDYSFCTSHPSTFINWGVTYSEEWTESDASSRSPPNSPHPLILNFFTYSSNYSMVRKDQHAAILARTRSSVDSASRTPGFTGLHGGRQQQV